MCHKPVKAVHYPRCTVHHIQNTSTEMSMNGPTAPRSFLTAFEASPTTSLKAPHIDPRDPVNLRFNISPLGLSNSHQGEPNTLSYFAAGSKKLIKVW